MTAMITETRRVMIRGTMAEGATIALWLAENCPQAARTLGSYTGDRLYETMIIAFHDDAEFAKFKLKHSEEFNEPGRREAEHKATYHAGSHAFPPGRAKLIINGNSHVAGFSLPDEEEDDD